MDFCWRSDKDPQIIEPLVAYHYPRYDDHYAGARKSTYWYYYFQMPGKISRRRWRWWSSNRSWVAMNSDDYPSGGGTTSVIDTGNNWPRKPDHFRRLLERLGWPVSQIRAPQPAAVHTRIVARWLWGAAFLNSVRLILDHFCVAFWDWYFWLLDRFFHQALHMYYWSQTLADLFGYPITPKHFIWVPLRWAYGGWQRSLSVLYICICTVVR